jgi:ketosteroid isomerase-like protein
MSRLSFRSLVTGAVFLLPPIAGCNPSDTSSPNAPSVGAAATPMAANGARASATESPQAAAVIAALKAYEAAVVASDTVTLKKIWADDYIFINAQGTLATRAQRLANFASGATDVFEGVNQREIIVHVYGDNAVLFQLFTLRGRFGGVETNTEVRGSFTWIKRAGRWQLVANQVIPVVS